MALFYFHFLINFLLQLIYNILSISAVQQSDPVSLSHTHTHILFFSHYPPSCSILSEQIQFPLLCSRISLLKHSKCNSLHLLTPNSQSLPLLSLPLGNHKSVLHVCEFVSFLQIGSFMLYIRDLWLPRGRGREWDGLGVWAQQMQTIAFGVDMQ